MMFDNRRIVSAAGEDVVKVYDKLDGRHWDCGSGVTAEEEGRTPAIVERVKIKDGYGFLFRCRDFSTPKTCLLHSWHNVALSDLFPSNTNSRK
jgi:hypothetical protein